MKLKLFIIYFVVLLASANCISMAAESAEADLQALISTMNDLEWPVLETPSNLSRSASLATNLYLIDKEITYIRTNEAFIREFLQTPVMLNSSNISDNGRFNLGRLSAFVAIDSKGKGRGTFPWVDIVVLLEELLLKDPNIMSIAYANLMERALVDGFLIIDQNGPKNVSLLMLTEEGGKDDAMVRWIEKDYLKTCSDVVLAVLQSRQTVAQRLKLSAKDKRQRATYTLVESALSAAIGDITRGENDKLKMRKAALNDLSDVIAKNTINFLTLYEEAREIQASKQKLKDSLELPRGAMVSP